MYMCKYDVNKAFKLDVKHLISATWLFLEPVLDLLLGLLTGMCFVIPGWDTLSHPLLLLGREGS